MNGAGTGSIGAPHRLDAALLALSGASSSFRRAAWGCPSESGRGTRPNLHSQFSLTAPVFGRDSRCPLLGTPYTALTLCLLCNHHLLSLGLGLALPRPRMLPPPFLLDPSRLEHRPLELAGLVDWPRDVSAPTSPSPIFRSIMETGKTEWGSYRETLPTCASYFQRSLSASRYSIAARSRAVMTPSLSSARAFQMRTFPSSEPVSTNRASSVYSVEVILCPSVNQIASV